MIRALHTGEDHGPGAYTSARLPTIPDDSMPFPQTMYVDWVRVYQRD